MALVANGFIGRISVVDTSGSISTLRYDLNVADIAGAEAAMTALIAGLDPITRSEISEYTYGPRFTEDAFAFPADAENAIKASLSLFLDTVGNKRANMKIPAPADDIFVGATGSDYNRVDGSSALLNAYLQLFTTGGTGIAFISDGETLRDTGYFDKGKRISAASQNP